MFEEIIHSLKELVWHICTGHIMGSIGPYMAYVGTIAAIVAIVLLGVINVITSRRTILSIIINFILVVLGAIGLIILPPKTIVIFEQMLIYLFLYTFSWGLIMLGTTHLLAGYKPIEDVLLERVIATLTRTEAYRKKKNDRR